MRPVPFPNVHVNSFRGLHDLHLEDCGAINILVGSNNSGKTSVLEAILLLAAPVDPRQWEGAVELRSTWPLTDMRFQGGGLDRLDSLTWLFPHRDDHVGEIDLHGGGPFDHIVATAERIVGEAPDRPIVSAVEVVEGSFKRMRQAREAPERAAPSEPGLVIELTLDWQKPATTAFPDLHDRFRMVLWESGRSFRPRNRVSGPAIAVAFATPISHRSDGYLAARVSGLLRAKKKNRAIELLKGLDRRVLDLVMLTPDDADANSAVPRGASAASLYVEFEGTGLVPIHAIGDGMRRALHLAAVVAELDSGGVLLVDEIEVGMHTAVLQGVFQWLCQSCREVGVQLFATTHSLEAIDAMLAGAPNDDLVLYRLKDSRAQRLTGDILQVARVDLGQEVR